MWEYTMMELLQNNLTFSGTKAMWNKRKATLARSLGLKENVEGIIKNNDSFAELKMFSLIVAFLE